MKDLFRVIEGVQLSEKATFLSENNNVYVFKVDQRSNKIEISRAVEKLLQKKVISVKTANYSGKKKRGRRNDFGMTKSWKKAFVKLKEGESLELV